MSGTEKQRLRDTRAEHRRNLKTAKRQGLTKVMARETRIIARIEKRLKAR